MQCEMSHWMGNSCILNLRDEYRILDEKIKFEFLICLDK